MLLRRGLKYGITIYAVTQRPSESDKTAIGNATHIHLCRMTRNQDRRYMAAEMDIPVEKITSMSGDADNGGLMFIQRDMRLGVVRYGTLTFSNGKPKFTLAKP